MLLVTSTPDEVHCARLRTTLQTRGAEALVFDPARFPAETSLSVSYAGATQRAALRLDGREVDLARVGAVWWQRPDAPQASPLVPPEQRDWAAGQARAMLDGLWDGLEAVWVPGRRRAAEAADAKLRQLRLAQRVGLHVPRTLVSNDPAQVLPFYDACQGRLVSKVLRDGRVWQAGEKHLAYTHVVRRRDLQRLGSVAQAPVIFQERVEKQLEVRVTVVGERVFSAEIESQASPFAGEDYRRADDSVACRPHTLSTDTAARCVDLVRALELSFGALDLVLTPSGQHVFLELNPNGRWAWVETRAGLKVAEALADLMVSAQRGAPRRGPVPSALEQAVLDGVALLRTLPRARAEAGQARERFEAFRRAHPEAHAELVTDWSGASTRVDYDLLLRDEAHGTLALSQAPASGSPWNVEHAEHWAAQRVLTLDEQVLSVHDALRLWQARALHGPGVMDELLDEALVSRELDDQEPVSTSELQRAADALRLRLGLHERAHTLRWLEEHGSSVAGLDQLARREVQRERWLGRTFAAAGRAYFERHPEQFERVEVFLVSGASQVLEDLGNRARSGVTLLAALDERLRAGAGAALEGRLERRYAWQLPRELQHAAPTELVGPIQAESRAWLAQVLARSASEFDEGTQRSVRSRLFERWLERARGAADIRWHWL